jgi:hypothetical protein
MLAFCLRAAVVVLVVVLVLGVLWFRANWFPPWSP